MNLHYQISLRKRALLFVLLWIILLFSASCENEEAEIRSNNNFPKTEKISSQLIEKIQSAGFNTSEGLSKFKNGYLVEYDLFLTEAQIDEIIKNKNTPSNAKTEHYRASNLVLGTPRTIWIYMEPSFDQFMQDAFDLAIARYNAVNLGLTFKRTLILSSANIRINPFYENSGTLGYSSLPSGGNPYGHIYLNTYYYNRFIAPTNAATTIAHEIGHSIGFQHTDIMNNGFSCGGGGYQESFSGGVNHIPGTPTQASANSWMLACSNIYVDRPFTPEDIAALKNTYPPRTHPAGTTSVYRYFNTRTGDHFYTMNWYELGTGRDYYKYEGVPFFIYETEFPNTTPLYRYFNTKNGDHYYTVNYSDLGGGIGGYIYEGISGYVHRSQASGTVPVYRYYNNRDHYYTINWSDLGGGSGGYRYEGIVFYVFP